ncbi:hypothetical protein ABZ470_26030 [Streptosporangium sp. NPDC020072]|uniref:hypothetical protein n=1 Tax=Streptosporangium sp. NPDC020072 TaxID=3154788 RepID=UPI0034476022
MARFPRDSLMIGPLAVLAVLGVAAAGCSGDGAADSRGASGRASGHGTPAEGDPPLSAGVWTETVHGGSEMTRVVAVAPGEAWAVGTDGEPVGPYGGSLWRWDGHEWRSTRPPGSLRYPTVVSGTAATNVWIFDQDADMWRWDGRRWTSRGRPPWPRSARLNDAVVAGPEDVWIAGGQITGTRQNPRWRPLPLAHWSPSGWAEVPVSSASSVKRLSAAAPDDLWALTRDDLGEVSAIEHWNGRRWRAVPAPPSLSGAKASFRDVVAVSAREVWVAGTIMRPGRRQAALLMRWDGSRWDLPGGVPEEAISFGSVAPDGHGGVWLGASNYAYDEHRILLHFDGRSWTREKAPKANNAPEVFDIAKVPGGDQVFAVGGSPSHDEDSRGWVWTRR